MPTQAETPEQAMTARKPRRGRKHRSKQLSKAATDAFLDRVRLELAATEREIARLRYRAFPPRGGCE